MTQFAAVNDRMKKLVFESFKTYTKREYELKEKAKQISSKMALNTLKSSLNELKLYAGSERLKSKLFFEKIKS